MRVYIPAGRASFYIRFKFRGISIYESLRTDEKATARRRAQNILDTVQERYFEGHRGGEKTTFAQIETAYTIAPLNCSTAARRHNVSLLLRICCPSMERAAALTQTLTRCTAAAIQQYQSAQLARGRPPGSINSDLRQARSVFSRHARQAYEASKINLPGDIQKFLNQPGLRDRRQKTGYVPIPRDALAALDDALVTLRQTNRAMWLVVMMMRSLGMRNSEVLRATGSQLIQHQGQFAIDLRNTADASIKNELEGIITLDPLLASELGAVAPCEYIVYHGKSKTARRNFIYKDTNRWLRKFIPGRTKCLYELRKEAGSVTAHRDGVFAAKKFLRHQSQATTERYYLGALSAASSIFAPECTA